MPYTLPSQDRVTPAFGVVRRRATLGIKLDGRTGNLPSSGLSPDQSQQLVRLHDSRIMSTLQLFPWTLLHSYEVEPSALSERSCDFYNTSRRQFLVTVARTTRARSLAIALEPFLPGFVAPPCELVRYTLPTAKVDLLRRLPLEGSTRNHFVVLAHGRCCTNVSNPLNSLRFRDLPQGA